MNLKGLALYLSAAVLPFGQLPFRDVDEPATCLRATGVPGELVRARADSLEFLDTRLQRVRELPAPRLEGCPQVAPGLLAYVLRRSEHSNVTEVHAYLDGKDAGRILRPGGAEGTPAASYVLTIGDPGENQLAAASSPRGDALVAVTSLAPDSRAHVVVSRRAPGGAFGPRETLYAARARSLAPTIAAGISDAGEAIVAWAVQSPSATADRELWVATAPPGAPFGEPRKLADLRLGAPFALAVGADGRALLAFAPPGHELAPPAGALAVAKRRLGGELAAPAGALAVAERRLGSELAAPVGALAVAERRLGGELAAPAGALAGELAAPASVPGGALAVAERPPGGEFGAPVRVGAVSGVFGAAPAAALRPDGSAVVVWSDLDGGGTQVVMRAAPGAFGPPATLAPDAFDTTALARASAPALRLLRGTGVDAGGQGAPRIAFLADGRTLVTWAGAAPGGGAWWLAPHVAILGGPAQAVGAPLLEAGAVTPLIRADGRPAVAWTDEQRLHIAVEGESDTPDRAPPAVTVRRLHERVLEPDEPLELAIRCSAACDVRAQLEDSVDGIERFTLSRAGTQVVALGSDVKAFRGAVRVRVRSGAPGAGHARERTVTFRVRRRPGPLFPRIQGLTARRVGSRVIVRWHTSRPVLPSRLLVYGVGANGDVVDNALMSGAPRTRFSTRLNAGRRVTILIDGRNGGLDVHSTAVR